MRSTSGSPTRSTIPTAILSQGAALGVIVALPLLIWIIVHYSWHWAFGTLGLIRLAWVAAWYFVGRDGPIEDPPMQTAGAERVGYARILLAPTFISCVLACFGAYRSLSLDLTWFTLFVVKGLGFPRSSAGWIAALPWVKGACTVMLAGWTSQVLVGRGVSTRMARGVLGTVPLIAGGLFMAMLPWVSAAEAKIAILVVGTGLTGPIYVVCAPMISEFTPLAQRGAAIAIFGAIYTLAGVVAPFANGSVIESAAMVLDGYQTGYLICAGMQIAGGICGQLLMCPAADRARITNYRIASAVARSTAADKSPLQSTRHRGSTPRR